jgi:integrase
MAGRRDNGEGTIYKRKGGRWCAVLDTPAGKRYFTGKKRADVVARFEAAKTYSAQSRLVGTGEQSVRDYLDTWVTSMEPNLRYNSYINYRSYLGNVVPALGPLKLSDLTADHIDACYATLHPKYSATTVRETHRVLKAALTRAVQRGMLSQNPCDLVTPPRRAKSDIVCLDLAQVRQLISRSEGHPYRTLCCLLVTTGLRIGEALGLQWDDIDWSGGTLSVKRQCQRVEGGIELSSLKSSAAYRTVPVPQSVLALLADHRRVQVDLRAELWSWPHPELVFPNDVGNLMRAGQVWAPFKTMLRACGLPEMRIHDLRHTAITNWLREPGMYLKQVSVRAGHSNPSITLGIYSHVMPDMGNDTARWLDEVLSGGT